MEASKIKKHQNLINRDSRIKLSEAIKPGPSDIRGDNCGKTLQPITTQQLRLELADWTQRNGVYK